MLNENIVSEKRIIKKKQFGAKTTFKHMLLL